MGFIKKGFYLSISVSCAALMWGQQTLASTPFTLEKAVELGLKTNPEFSSVLNNKAAASQQLSQAKSLFYPSIDLQADAGYEKTDSPVLDNQELDRRRISLTLTQLLFDGQNTAQTINRQKANLQSFESRVEEAQEFVALDIVESYLNVLRYRTLINIAQKNIQDHLGIEKKISDGEKTGRYNQGDLAQVQTRTSRARATYENVRRNLTEAESSYSRSVGEKPVEALSEPSNLLKLSLLSDDVEQFVSLSKSKSPTLASFHSDVKVAKADLGVAKSNYFPKVDLQVSGSQGEDLSGIEGDETRGSALVVMSWNWFRGGADKSRIKETRYSLASAKDNQMNAQRALENDIRDTWAAMEAAKRRKQEFSKQINANAKVIDVYQDQFKLGKRSLLDLLDAQNELFVSRNSEMNDKYTALFAGYRLLALSGSLVENLSLEKNKDINLSQTE